jgi:O-antigen/teichoic acid export membrane protein
VAKSNSRNILGLSSANAFAQILQFAAFLFLARQLGPFHFGTYLIALVVSAFVVSFFDFGRGAFFTRELAFARLNIDDFWAQSLGRIGALTFVCLSVAFFLMLNGQFVGATTCLLISTQHTFQLVQALAKSEIKTAKLSLAIIADRFLFALIIVITGSFSLLTAEMAIISSAICQLVGAAILLFRVRIATPSLKLGVVLRSLNPKPSFHLGIFSITNSLTTLDQAILGTISGQVQTGLYGAVSKWFAPLGIMSGSVSIVVANDAAKKHRSALGAIISGKETWFLLIGVSLSTAIAGVFGSQVVILVLGDGYEKSVNLFIFLAISASLSFLSSPIASLLQYFHKDRAVSVCIGTLGMLYVVMLSLFLADKPNEPALLMSQMQLGLQACIFTCLTVILLQQSRSLRRESNL